MKFRSRAINRILTIISITALIWVSYKMWSFNEWKSFTLYLKHHSLQIPGLLFLQIILLTINLSLETYKWQLLVRPVSCISFRHAFIQVIKGIQLGMVTPARAGDPIGKSIFFKPQERARVIILSFTGSIIQNIVILLTTIWAIFSGGKSISDFMTAFSNYYSGTNIAWFLIIGVTVLLASWLLIKRFAITKSLLRHISSQLRVLKGSKTTILLKIGSLTALRYFVFTSQFLILLRFFGMTDTETGLSSIFLFYGAISFLPSAGAGDLGIRTTVALLVFGQTVASGPAIVMASLLLWFFNLGIPALLPVLFKIAISFKSFWQKSILPT
jgi:hypothetical protein